MKKIWYFIRNIFMGVFVMIWAILFTLWIIIKTPFHYFTYCRSHFYRNTGTKFNIGFVDCCTFRLYELIHEHDLPIRYLTPKDPKNIHHGCFLAGTTLLIHDWTVYNPGNDVPLADTLAETLILLRADYPDSLIEDVRILMDLNNLTSEEKECVKADPLFLLYSDNDQMLEVLCNFCTAR